ncbi:hypothetical protein Q7P37_003917 [Cladosporium fusiforme]
MTYRPEQHRSEQRLYQRDPTHDSPTQQDSPQTSLADDREELLMLESDTEKETHLETQAQSPEALYCAQNSFSTPRTLPPAYSAEAIPFSETRQQTPSYIYTSTPIVCCRAGFRPVSIPTTNNESSSYGSAPPEKDDRPEWRHEKPGLDNDFDATLAEYRGRVLGRWSKPNHLRRWMIALATMAGLFLLHRLLSNPGDASINGEIKHYSNRYTQVFDKVESFSLFERIETAGRLGGKGLWIEPAPEEQTADIVVSVSYEAPWPNRVTSPNWERTDSSIRLGSPTLSNSFMSVLNPFESSLSITVVLYVRTNLALQSLSIETTSLGINSSRLFDSCNANLTIDTTTITSPSQPVQLQGWNSRKTTIHTVSSGITGTYTLLDLLSLSSVSGTVNARVIPGEADPSHPAPAHLKVSTASSSVRIEYPPFLSTSPIPDREYHSSISTTSGSIAGEYLLGATTSLTTLSGSIDADFLPSGSHNARLETSSGSGTTHVCVLSGENESELEGLRSEHKSSSGSVKAVFADEWEGRITESSGSGSVKVAGPDLVVDDSRAGHMVAHKGDESSGRIDVQTGSGSVDVTIGRM